MEVFNYWKRRRIAGSGEDTNSEASVDEVRRANLRLANLLREHEYVEQAARASDNASSDHSSSEFDVSHRVQQGEPVELDHGEATELTPSQNVPNTSQVISHADAIKHVIDAERSDSLNGISAALQRRPLTLKVENTSHADLLTEVLDNLEAASEELSGTDETKVRP